MAEDRVLTFAARRFFVLHTYPFAPSLRPTTPHPRVPYHFYNRLESRRQQPRRSQARQQDHRHHGPFQPVIFPLGLPRLPRPRLYRPLLFAIIPAQPPTSLSLTPVCAVRGFMLSISTSLETGRATRARRLLSVSTHILLQRRFLFAPPSPASCAPPPQPRSGAASNTT